jgi:hypothetical protein
MDEVEKMKQRLFEKLVHNLEDMTKHYRTLLDTVRKEKDLLLNTNIEKLNENNVVKEQTLFKIKSLDGLRLNYASELAQLIGADHREPRLLEMAKMMGGAESDRLRSLHSTLEIITKRLVEINKENAIYAESALKTVNAAMENIKDTFMGSQKTYQKKGTYQPGSDKAGHLVRREA